MIGSQGEPVCDPADARAIDPRRYHETVAASLSPVAPADPVCLYLETTNRCNLLCTTCPRTYADLEPEADMSWELFTRIVDQVPNIARVVLHGVGEPMLVKDLPRRVRYLKDRGTYVLFNTNGTALTAKNGRALAEAGLDELRISLDAVDARTFKLVRGTDDFPRILRNVAAFTEMQKREGLTRPRVSLWLTGLKETIAQLADFVRLAHEIGVPEVYLQRLVFCEESPFGLARPDQALFARLTEDEARHLAAAEAEAAALGISFNASGATEPGESLARTDEATPWSLCRRPWTVLYVTANGRALPCCIAPFSQAGYGNYTLGDLTGQTVREIWNSQAYRQFRSALQSDAPPKCCAGCGLRWSL
jgi:MoaA/NifB/PqqE/SkfB family radical SAM enzyme